MQFKMIKYAVLDARILIATIRIQTHFPAGADRHGGSTRRPGSEVEGQWERLPSPGTCQTPQLSALRGAHQHHRLVKSELVQLLILIGQHININQVIYTSHDNKR